MHHCPCAGATILYFSHYYVKMCEMLEKNTTNIQDMLSDV